MKRWPCCVPSQSELNSHIYITSPFNNMRTLKFKDQPTNVFFATVNQMFSGSSQLPTTAERAVIGTLRYDDGKARTATAGPVVLPKTNCLRFCIFAKDGHVKNSNFAQAIHRSNHILKNYKSDSRNLILSSLI